jgi:hypothetical protein
LRLGALAASAFWSRLNFSAITLLPPLALLVTRRNQIAEDVRVLPVIVAIGKLIEVERQIISRNLVMGADYATLEQAPDALDIVGVDVPAHIFAVRMINRLMRDVARHLCANGQRGALIQRLTFRSAGGRPRSRKGRPCYFAKEPWCAGVAVPKLRLKVYTQLMHKLLDA